MALVDSDSRGPLVVLGDSSGRVVLWRPGADTEEFVLDLLRPVPSLLIVGRSRLLVATGRKLLEFDLYTCVHQYLQNDRVPLVREMLKADIWNQPDTAAGNARMDGDAQASEGVHTSEGVQIGDIKTMLVNEGQTLLAGVVDQSLVVWDVLTRAVKYVNVNEQIYSVQFALNKPTLKNLCDDAMPARLPTSNPQLFVPPQLQTTACVTGMHRQHVFAEPEALTKLFDAYIESSLYVSRKRPLDLPRDQQFAVNAVIQLEMKSTQLSQDQAMKENKLQRLTTFFKALDRRPVCPPVDRHQPGTDTSHLLRLMYQSVNPLLPGPVKRPSKFKQTKTAYFVPPASWTKQ
ncbi:hypothetical protein GNI_114780 [Gregarina niphandrodes]|uniref:Uncharacterized protein n=1 Tax=Gregarina niphandrodes TaxID=110365 RepID=A0A023B316_GRENI|nr:hypothetical protein GNI_114780 [Gregarina niphandrodes]EZG55312.1 hypothetical protein GNI_114780 [Gregarina niphandrodes]|eukprot:XP_011131646.1 hypothetical protein GNI_114780 [Gregarina niphandrodes]